MNKKEAQDTALNYPKKDFSVKLGNEGIGVELCTSIFSSLLSFPRWNRKSRKKRPTRE